MRQDDLKKLGVLYPLDAETEKHRRFTVAVGASVPSAGQLAGAIAADLGPVNFGISWWDAVPVEEQP